MESLDDPRIRVDSQVKSIFIVEKGKKYLLVHNGNSDGYYQWRILLKMPLMYVMHCRVSIETDSFEQIRLFWMHEIYA